MQKRGERMNGLNEYLDWRGDLSMLTVLPNEIDLLIFSQLVYAPLERISTLHGETLTELTSIIYPKPITKENRLLPFQRYELWQQVCKCERFSQVKLTRFAAQFDSVKQKQFAAACFTVGNISIIAYRGTDATLTGWKEDFNLAFEDAIPAQLEAIDFLNHSEANARYLYLCGHSKGGNLAMYAASRCCPEILNRILNISNFDGPGLSEAAVKNSHWNEIQHLVHTYVPESSVIGMLFNTQNQPQLVVSDSISILQHNPFNWHILGSHFVEAQSTTLSSRIIDDTLDFFFNHCTPEQRRVLIDTLYDILNVSKAKYLRDIPTGIIRNIPELRNVIRSCSPETRKELANIAQIGAEAIGDSFFKKRLIAAITSIFQGIADSLPAVENPGEQSDSNSSEGFACSEDNNTDI